MGLFLKKQLDTETLIGIWKIEENLDELLKELFKFGVGENSHDVLSLKKFNSEARKLEWLSTRVLTNHLFGKNTAITHDSFGKPYLNKTDMNISISHSHGMVAVVLSTKEKIGIDIEKLSEKIAKIALRFLNIEEYQEIEGENKILHLYLHWCAKETLYKIHSKKNLTFTENLKILPFKVSEQGSLQGEIITESTNEKYVLHYFTIDEYVVVWGSK